MIQRIQSLWLFLAAACAMATFKFPYYSGTSAKNIPDTELSASSSVLLLILTVAVGGLALYTIFMFKKRSLQKWLCLLGILLEALLIFLYYRETKTSFIKGNLSFWAILHGIIVYMFFMAARGIIKDEKMVKESERLR
jgi:hypothetical protein